MFITHVTQILKNNAPQILNREDIQTMLDSLKREAPTLVKDVEENVKLGLVQKVVGTLLEEKYQLRTLKRSLSP